MSLLQRNDQQPNAAVKSYRWIRYNVEEVLIGGVMGLEALCILYAHIPILFVFTTALITAIVITLLGGI